LPFSCIGGITCSFGGRRRGLLPLPVEDLRKLRRHNLKHTSIKYRSERLFLVISIDYKTLYRRVKGR
jgi:hypothetical protein